MDIKLKISYNAPAVLTFVLLSFAVLLAGFLTEGRSTKLLFRTYRSSLGNPLTYLRLFTHVLGHSGWSHFIGNASYLLLLGPMLEEKYGSRMIIEMIVITALVTAIINGIVFPDVALCGASGVVYAFIFLAPFTGGQEGAIPLTFILVAVIFIGQQIYEGITVSENISYISHIAGGLVGAVVGYLLNKTPL